MSFMTVTDGSVTGYTRLNQHCGNRMKDELAHTAKG